MKVYKVVVDTYIFVSKCLITFYGNETVVTKTAGFIKTDQFLL